MYTYSYIAKCMAENSKVGQNRHWTDPVGKECKKESVVILN